MAVPERLFDPFASERAVVEREFHTCSLRGMGSPPLTVAGLFAGIGGIETGLARAGLGTELVCESWAPAQAVLRERFPDIDLADDVTELGALPKVDVVTAGFPCTDLSQAGRTQGIRGRQSGLVAHVFRLLDKRRVPWVVLENVRNMLALDQGRAMRFLVDELEALGYRWAYRLVDSRFTGVPQRRQRVIMVASRVGDPRQVLFADDAGKPDDRRLSEDAFGFFWTEGLRGLGWARDAVPTLKGGSTIGIPSPPGIWYRSGEPGRRIVVPGIEDAESLQGFPRGWTAPASATSMRKGVRWKLVGNAVTVGVAAWVGHRLVDPDDPADTGRPLQSGERWPPAAWGGEGRVWTADVSMWPHHAAYCHLAEAVDLDRATPLSARAAAGFLGRAHRGTLRIDPEFLVDVKEHVEVHTG